MSGILLVRSAGNDHQVVTVISRYDEDQRRYCRKPCAKCPWRQDAVGEFPAEAFRHSAGTAYDMATHTFACHAVGKENPKICAGFLIRGSDHNLTVRLERMAGNFHDVVDGGINLFDNYRDMAIANGVEVDDPILLPCRD